MSNIKENKRVKQYRIAESLDDELDRIAKETGKTKTLLIEEALVQYLYTDKKKEREMLAEEVIRQYDIKYGNMFTGLRLGTRTAEHNSFILMQVVNSMLKYHGINENAYAPIARSQHGMITKAKEDLQDIINKNKQRKDNAVKGE